MERQMVTGKTTDDAMAVHFDLWSLDKAADHAYCRNCLDAKQAQDLRDLWCLSSNLSNTSKDASVKRRKRGCVVPAFRSELKNPTCMTHGIRANNLPKRIPKR